MRYLIVLLLGVLIGSTFNPVGLAAQARTQYRVVTMSSGSGVLVPELFERELNSEGATGWRLLSFEYLGRGGALVIFQKP